MEARANEMVDGDLERLRQTTSRNVLYYGDNLDILRRYVPDRSADLVYLDPPFNSNVDYNVLFAERDGTRAAAQIKAFEDTWRWDVPAGEAFQETVDRGGPLAHAMLAFKTVLGGSDMLAYLAMMAPRLVELRRVLKESRTPDIGMPTELIWASIGAPNVCNN